MPPPQDIENQAPATDEAGAPTRVDDSAPRSPLATGHRQLLPDLWHLLDLCPGRVPFIEPPASPHLESEEGSQQGEGYNVVDLQRQS